MAGPLLSSEPLQRYRALGLAGDPVWRAARQLRAAIAQRLSREHADLLAIPEVDPSGRRIDWYAPFDGEVRRLADLGEAERAAVLRQGAAPACRPGRPRRVDGGAERSGAERNFARLLRHALTAPGEETLYVVDGKPVMTFWGFSADAALPGVFLRQPRRRLRLPPPAAAIPRSGDGVGAGRCDDGRAGHALDLVAVAAARAAAAVAARRPRLAAAALPAASRAAPRSRGARPCAGLLGAPAGRAAAGARRHPAAGQ